MKMHFGIAALLGLTLSLATASGAAQQPTRVTLPGVTNLSRVGTEVACSGAITPEAVPEIKKLGFVSIINLRESNEPGANVEAEGVAAKDSGLHYYHVPFNAATPDPTSVEKFLDAITTKGAEPAFIHCAAGGRAAALWMIKRLAVDHWEVERAAREAEELGLTNPKLRQWAVDYGQSHRR